MRAPILAAAKQDHLGTYQLLRLPNTSPAKQPANRKKVILVVDDESGIRDFLSTYLHKKNFRVLTADCAAAALAIWEEEQRKIDLLLTDVIMPGMDGKVLADRMLQENAGLKVIFMSGYLPYELAEETPDHAFFKKPFHPAELLEAVRKALH